MKNAALEHIIDRKATQDDQRKTVFRKHLAFFMASIIVVIVFTLIFKFVVDSIGFHKSTIIRMMILLFSVFTVLELAVLYMWVIREYKPFSHAVKFMKGNRVYAVLCALVAAACFIPVAVDYVTDSRPYGYYNKEMVKVEGKEDCVDIVGPITRDTEVVQTFVSEFDTVTAISLSVATYARNNDCQFYVRLIDVETGSVLEAWELDALDFDDNAAITLISENPVGHFDMKGRTYRIEITSSSDSPEQAVTLHYSTVDLYKNGQLAMNGKLYGRDLIMKISGIDGKDGYERVRIWLCIYLMIASEALLYYLRRRFHAK